MTDPPDLHRARRTIEAARLLAENGFSAEAVGRAYYAAFHASQAVLDHLGASSATHRGVHAAMHRLLAQPGHVPASTIAHLSRLSTLRQTADYDDGANLTPAQAQQSIAMAEAFVDAMAQWISEA